jgi:nucleoside-diphosphate-sugar epimerase
MPARLHVITGATGLIGSHIAERLAAQGERVRAIVRGASDTAFLQTLGAEFGVADLEDAEALSQSMADADVLYHCAAKVDDSGPWAMYEREIVDSTRRVMQCASRAGIDRVVHVSSLAAYGHPNFRQGQVQETDPLSQRLRIWDYYCRAKAISEEAARETAPGVTIIRPSLAFGERERSVFSRIVRTMRAGKAALLGSGDNLMNLVYAGDIAAGAIAAAAHEAARGQAYNLSSPGEITQREMYDLLASSLNLPPVRRRVPLGAAYAGAFALEAFSRLLHGPRPIVTRHGVSLLCRPVKYSTEKARSELGWQPAMPAAEGMTRMAAWIAERQRGAAS